jgi:hypothetical protein
MTADNNALATIYLAQFRGNVIALYNGVNWDQITSAEVSLALSGRTTDLPFDIFCYNSGGVPTLEFLDWTNATTRATALVRQDGVWCKSGALTRRYLGSCRARAGNTFSLVRNGVTTSSGAGTTAQIDLFNADNQVADYATQTDTTDSWTYTTAAFRQANGSATNQIEIMVGLQEKILKAHATVLVRSSTTSIRGTVGIGVDSTTVNSAQIVQSAISPTSALKLPSNAELNTQITIGRRFIAWLEYSVATGTTTWSGDDALASSLHQSGLHIRWEC